MTELTALAPPHAEVAAAIHARCFPQPWDRASFLSLLSMPGVFGWIARSDGDGPAGLVLCRRAGDECEVLTICVLPEERGRGIARRLLDSACDAAAGASAMFLEVAADNEPAGRLYHGARFVAVGRRKGYYARSGPAADAIILRRDLS